ncbi:MAG TPA: LytR C-terminal domain-containing protein [Nocardia sp.]|uniref:LytR C-terminal domain-containing protein n=1 Tax=Nocardia sp. TaxID=1821 RepID=UPI002B4B2006|nr:LytR C-terminal domain-containing protein [Nocardia sp.]HLS77901.1 LytR C-terminal domain-containing protein [Nocardia sp.]
MSYPNPTSGGPPLRALAMVLIALAIVFAGLGAMSISSADSDGEDSAAQATTTAAAAPATTTTAAATPGAVENTAPETTTEPAPETSATIEPPQTPLAAPPSLDRSVPVQVLNNSLVAGLAGRTADQLAANGWTNVRADNYAAETIPQTTVYYGDSAAEKAAAEAIAAELGAVTAPKPAGFGGGATGVVVILTGN